MAVGTHVRSAKMGLPETGRAGAGALLQLRNPDPVYGKPLRGARHEDTAALDCGRRVAQPQGESDHLRAKPRWRGETTPDRRCGPRRISRAVQVSGNGMDGWCARLSHGSYALFCCVASPAGAFRPSAGREYHGVFDFQADACGSRHHCGIGSRSVNAVLLTAPVAGCVADGVEVILGPQDQAITNEGWCGQRHFVEVVGAERFVFIAGADRERPAFFVQTKYLAVVAPGR